MINLKQTQILVTRPAHQAENLCELIRKNNGIPVRFPTLEIVPVILGDSEIKRHLTQANIVIFTSANAVRLYCSQLDDVRMWQLKTKSCFAIGQATAQSLETVGVSVDLMPKQGYNSEALLSLTALKQVSQQKILIIRGENGRETLADVLTQRGAKVHYQNVYRRAIPEIDCSDVVTLIKQKQLALISITSGEAIQNLVTMLPKMQHDLLKKIPLVVVS